MRGSNGKNADETKKLKEAGTSIVEIDIVGEESVNAGVEDAINKLGGLDVIVNNAGVGVIGMQEHFTPADWQKVFDVNVFGVQHVNRAALPHLRKQGSGMIIYIKLVRQNDHAILWTI